MKIPEELFNKWQDLRSYGDGKKISDQTGLSEVEISRAMTTRECSDKVFEEIAKYFKEKEEKVKEFL
jgi:hypothetical protein